MRVKRAVERVAQHASSSQQIPHPLKFRRFRRQHLGSGYIGHETHPSIVASYMTYGEWAFKAARLNQATPEPSPEADAPPKSTDARRNFDRHPTRLPSGPSRGAASPRWRQR